MKALSKREQNRLDKQNRILDAAIATFAEAGFSNASMDKIAVHAGITKPTLYQYYPSKDALFKAMMAAPRDVMMLAFDDTADTNWIQQLYRFAWVYAETVMRPDFLSIARLIIGEAHRFPDVGRDYQKSGPDRVLKGLMSFLDRQRSLGSLRFEDAELAAQDFWGLILSAPRNRALHVPDEEITKAMLARYIHNGLRVFLTAYSTQPDHDRDQLAHIIEQLKVETAND